MLNFFRRRDTVVRIMLGGFLVVICVAMVMFLIPQGMTGDSSLPLYQQTVATVNGTPIRGQEVTTQLQRYAQGQSLPPQLLPMLGEQVLRGLVLNQALADQAAKLGMAPSNAEIVEAARQQLPQLYPNGKYVGDQQAAQMIAQLQLTLPELQTELRQQIMINKIRDLVTDPVRVSDAAVKQAFEQDNEKATFSYAVFDPTALASQVTITPAALAAYYQKHQAAYNAPEKRQLDVLLANQAAIAATIQISPQAVHEYYQQNLAQYTHPEEVKVSHILLKFPSTTPTPADIAATRKRAEDVLKQVQAKPQDFAALAKKYSQDDGSAPQGGELGFIQRNQTVANFEKAAFSLPVGQISGLVQTEYGFHIIKVEAHQQAHVQTEAEVKDEIVATLQKDQAVDKAQQTMNQAASLAATTPLAQVAQQLHLQYFTTAPISRTDPVTGIGVDPNFAGAVFAAAAGGLTPPVQVAQGFALAKVVKIVPPGPQPLDAVKDAVTNDYRQELAKELAAQRAQALADAARKDGLKAAAASQHVTLKVATALTRSGSLPDVGALTGFADSLFKLKPGETGPVATVGESKLVYALTALQEPTDADFAQQKDSITTRLLSQKRDDVFGAYADALMTSLTKAGKVTIDQAALQRVLGNGQPSGPSTPAPTVPPSGLGLGS
jgi:peptidyl-prolyl cis-trans isomerase D